MPDPFDRPEVVASYEDWYATPFGHLADELERKLLRRLLAGLPRNASILEVACGTGHFGAALKAEGYDVVGIDRSSPMLARARSHFPVARADAAHLPLGDASVDAVVLVALLDFVDDPVLVLSEACRVARGPVAVLALVSHSYLALRRRVSGRRGHPIFASARFHSRAALLEFARRAGATIADSAQVLVLPPALAARWPTLERRLSGHSPHLGGILGLRLERAARRSQVP